MLNRTPCRSKRTRLEFCPFEDWCLSYRTTASQADKYSGRCRSSGQMGSRTSSSRLISSKYDSVCRRCLRRSGAESFGIAQKPLTRFRGTIRSEAQAISPSPARPDALTSICKRKIGFCRGRYIKDVSHCVAPSCRSSGLYFWQNIGFVLDLVKGCALLSSS